MIVHNEQAEKQDSGSNKQQSQPSPQNFYTRQAIKQRQFEKAFMDGLEKSITRQKLPLI